MKVGDKIFLIEDIEPINGKKYQILVIRRVDANTVRASYIGKESIVTVYNSEFSTFKGLFNCEKND